MINVQDLQNIVILKDVPPDNLAGIIPSLNEKLCSAGDTILYRGDPGYSMFMILAGKVAITLTNDEGIDYTINTLDQGDNFGEMALMTGEPRSATVKALTDVRLAELSQEAFFELIDRLPQLADSFLRQLAQRRAKTKVRQQFANLERAEIIANLFAHQPPEIDRFDGKSKWVADTNAAIDRLAAVNGHVLILGERGTGKELAARLIHFHSQEKDRPLFHLDCANPPPIWRDSEAGKGKGRDSLHLELAQESALFGHGADAGSYAKGIRKGYLELADSGTVVLENIDSLSEHVQRLLIKFLREWTFVRTGETELIGSKLRLIATSSRSREEIQSQGKLDPELLSLVSNETLLLKPLRERKKDIPEIAEHLLAKFNSKFGKSVSGFSKEALNNLVDHDWPLNVDEMHQVLERAVVIANEEVITERQVFLNVPTFSSTGKFNLLKIPFLRQVANHHLVPKVLRFATVPFILALTILTLIGPEERNPANLVVWAIWWPFLIFSIVVSARSWCGYCPLPVVSDGLNFYRKKFFAVPGFLSKYGVWIGIAGFALILLAEHGAHMFTAAHATSALLICILSGTVITNFFFGKRSWCKHICPLGRMVANSSAVSLLELGTNSNVCTSQCQTHDCIKDHNCPMGIHPSAAGTSKECVLCLSCVKRCKHLAIHIDARLPWHELDVRAKWNIADAFFAVSLTSLIMAVKIPSWGPVSRLISQYMPNYQNLADMVVAVMTAVLLAFLIFIASGLAVKQAWKQNFAISGSAYLFIAFAGFFNIYLHEFIYSGPNFLPWTLQWLGIGTGIPSEWITPNLGTLKVLVPLITLGGSIASFVMLARLCRKFGIPPGVQRAHQGVMLLTSLLFLVIL